MSVESPTKSDLRYLEDYDTGMGTNFETIEEDLLEGASRTAEELGFMYEPLENEYEIFFSRDDSKAFLYAESWGGAPKQIAEVIAFECDRRTDGKVGCPEGREIRIGNSNVEVNEGVLRGAAQYLEEKRMK